MAKTISIGDREIGLRIYSRYIDGVQEKLPEGVPFAEATVSASTDPVKFVVPFLWGIIQDRKSDELKTMNEAYDLFDDLVDAGYSGFKFSELVLDICTASGFFDERGEKMIRSSLEKMLTAMEQAGERLLESVTKEKTPTQQQPNRSTQQRKRSGR